ncbi:FecR family protein [Niabella hirudinis]|uniref:FecR family protein n=1 Tax=Niabella hirudinis TaxID=1285929 RepID=UPI003EB96757
MESDQQRLRHLLKSFANNAIAGEEIEEMLSLLRQDTNDAALYALIEDLRSETDGKAPDTAVDWERVWNAIRPVPSGMKWHWWRAAAVFIGILGIALYLWLNRREAAKPELAKAAPVQQQQKDIQPGGDRAVLTLADGSQIVLDSTANGKLAQQGSVEVIKLTNGQIVYKKAGGKENELLYNTMSTPRGGQYKLVLPDGSKVWLNALSSIRYPASFAGNERGVAITGEVYFEVARDPAHPFKVSLLPASGKKGMEVEVLGTHFNVNAYGDEPLVNTTLLEGSVKVKQAAGSIVIRPGQQAQVNSAGKMNVASNVDVAGVVAWKEGHFVFRDTDLKTIMHQLARWYDVDVKYEGDIPERYFTADISKNKPLSSVLKILEQSNIRFEIRGQTLTVMP